MTVSPSLSKLRTPHRREPVAQLRIIRPRRDKKRRSMQKPARRIRAAIRFGVAGLSGMGSVA